MAETIKEISQTQKPKLPTATYKVSGQKLDKFAGGASFTSNSNYTIKALNLKSEIFNHLLGSEQKLQTSSFCINNKTGNIAPISDIVMPEIMRHKLTATQLNQAQGFYHPRQMQPQGLRKNLGNQGSISSTNLPRINQKNVKIAGTRHPTTGIVFCIRGFPIFSDIMKAEVRIPYEIASIKKEANHMRAATRELRKLINEGKLEISSFNANQLKSIMSGDKNIPGYTWHHHQDIGKMQLVPKSIHQQTGHVGGVDIWNFKN